MIKRFWRYMETRKRRAKLKKYLDLLADALSRAPVDERRHIASEWRRTYESLQRIERYVKTGYDYL